MYLYVCMYLCMYVRTYVRTYVCMYVYMFACMFVCVYICMFVCMYESIYIYIYIKLCICVCMCIHMYACTQTLLMNVGMLISKAAHYSTLLFDANLEKEHCHKMQIVSTCNLRETNLHKHIMFTLHTRSRFTFGDAQLI